MKQRDFEIVKSLIQFRCLSRDDIIDLHFSNLKNKIGNANLVLKRLVTQGHIEVSTHFQPYVYFPSPSTVKKNSQKIPHFLKIASVYKELSMYQKPLHFDVEPKFGKEYMEPDAFAFWRGRPYFLEIQRHQYSNKFMQQKIDRYKAYFRSLEWQKLYWQTKEPVFPDILMITQNHYKLHHAGIVVHQVKNTREFVKTILPSLESEPIIRAGSENLKVRL